MVPISPEVLIIPSLGSAPTPPPTPLGAPQDAPVSASLAPVAAVFTAVDIVTTNCCGGDDDDDDDDDHDHIDGVVIFAIICHEFLGVAAYVNRPLRQSVPLTEQAQNSTCTAVRTAIRM